MTTKNEGSKLGMFVSDIPQELFLQFKVPCVERCNDTYWVRLKELLEKEVVYDNLIKQIEEDRK